MGHTSWGCGIRAKNSGRQGKSLPRQSIARGGRGQKDVEIQGLYFLPSFVAILEQMNGADKREKVVNL